MSNPVRNILLVSLGLTALVSLGLVLVALFGTQGGTPVAQEPYPAGTPPQPSPRAVGTTEPATPRATATPGAYVPPVTPWPTHTPWLTPESPPPPKPVGLQIVWAEAARDKETDSWRYTFYVADVGDIGNRKKLYTVPERFLVRATLSPNGSNIAYTAAPDDHFDDGGILWVLQMDTAQPQELTRQMDSRASLTGYPWWSSDSRMLACMKFAPRVSPPVSKESSPNRPELHIITVDGKEDRILIAEDDMWIYPLGWSSGNRMLCVLSKPDVGRELWTVDAVTGSLEFVTALPEQELPSLSPDGQRLLIRTAGGADWLSVDERERRTVAFAGVSTTMPTPNVPLYSPEFATVTADIYWASAAEVIFQTGLTTWRIGNLDTGAVRDVTVAPTLRPSDEDQLLSVSPDMNWLAVRNYSRDGLHLLKANSRVRIPIGEKGIYFVGWLSGSR